ncbi:metal-dependent hydrolase [Moraxella sp. FZLJ2107]|uniref:metal-dependent hydrolase n=1 Tax=unclassified Moraxella TaxID=2685852 RepID=UPI0020C8A1E3|nr:MULTISPECIES: metal-dependent hydrolase [unclassified Moraxella]UTO04070.1 metal-dependent hydrolase [Moraxella sp. FZLJ2107]UTO22902.1 metal-dependent hydrolase [Moraxella sp. FZLJ2109]
MANFQTHLSVGAAASIAIAGGGHYAELYGITTAVLCAIVGTLGSLLPDIDLEHSKPASQGFFAVSLIVSTLITILYANRYSADQLVLDALILWATAFLVLRFGLFELFSRLTTHRGMVHSVPYMAVFALALVSGVFYGLKLTAFVSWVFGAMLFIGAMVHLLLDEIYSVNAFGLKLKKSFGTALKFFETDKLIQYACLYAVLAVLFYIAPPYQDFWRGLVRVAKLF